jgi:ribulose-phosphate 3-epimerase
MEIVPAILPKSYYELEEKLEIAAPHTHAVQVDICDGGFVPSRTWPYLKGTESDIIFDEIVSQEKAFPHWENIDFEFDLMVRNVYEKIPDFISAGASRIVVHLESVDQAELDLIIRDYGKHSEELGPFDVELGIALMPSASPEDIKHILPNIHFVQVMGIDKIGFQGQTMTQKAIDLVAALRLAYPELLISVDGGVNLETAPKLADAGADRVVVGSALFEADDFLGTLKRFESL